MVTAEKMNVIKGVLEEELQNSIRMKKQYERALSELPKGSLVEKKIKVLEGNKANAETQLCNPIVLKDSKKVQNLMIDLKKYNQELTTLTKIHEQLILKIKELY